MGKSAKFRNYQEMVDFMKANKKEPPDIIAFFLDNVILTKKDTDFVIIRDLYQKYKKITNSWDRASRYKFTRTIRVKIPQLIYKQKKVGGYPELVFMGCKYQ